MSKTARRRNIARPPETPTLWGEWEDRSRVLALHPANRNGKKIFTGAFVNAVLSVQISEEPSAWGAIIHLWVRRHDHQPLIWADLMQIKNELLGPERVGIEVCPKVSQLVDQAAMYHLYVLPAGFELPFGLHLEKAA